MGYGRGMRCESGYDIGEGGMGWGGGMEGFVFISALCLCVCGECRESCALDESYSCSSGPTGGPLYLSHSLHLRLLFYTMKHHEFFCKQITPHVLYIDIAEIKF
jgi:hypothetical protein